jgi:seryl-tRNA synthetase
MGTDSVEGAMLLGGDHGTVEDAAVLEDTGRLLRARLQPKEAELGEMERTLHAAASSLPNETSPQAPVGAYDASRIRAVHGSAPTFAFEPKHHMDVMLGMNGIDTEWGSFVVGQRGYFLKRDMALLELVRWTLAQVALFRSLGHVCPVQALVNYAVQFWTSRGYIPIATPDMVRSWVAEGCGFRPKDPATQVYNLATPHEESCMVATAGEQA